MAFTYTEYNNALYEKENDIAIRLAQVMRQRRVSAARLAKLTGLSEEETESFSRGKEPVPASSLFLIACALGVSLTHLFAEDGDNADSAATRSMLVAAASASTH